jgi:hypothetical protein
MTKKLLDKLRSARKASKRAQNPLRPPVKNEMQLIGLVRKIKSHIESQGGEVLQVIDDENGRAPVIVYRHPNRIGTSNFVVWRKETEKDEDVVKRFDRNIGDSRSPIQRTGINRPG